MTEPVLIPLRDRDGVPRAYAIIDATDADWVNQWRWSLCAGYASRKESRTLKGDRPNSRTLLLHRELLGLEPGDPRVGDHINTNPLDDRRSNLRILTRAENNQNMSSRLGGTSRYRGVMRTKQGRWRAAVQINYRIHIVGEYADEHEAGRAVAEFRAKHMPYSAEAAA